MSGKINLWLLIFIILGVIAGSVYFGIYIFEQNAEVEYVDQEQKIKQLEKEIEDLKEELKTYKGEDETTEKESSTKIDDKKVKESLQNYLEIMGIYQASPVSVLKHLGYSDEEINGSPAETGEIETNIKYEDFRSKIFKYMSEDLYLANEFIFHQNEESGNLFYPQGSGCGLKYEVKSIKEISELKYSAVIEERLDDPDLGENSKRDKNIEFTVQNDGENLVISSVEYK